MSAGTSESTGAATHPTADAVTHPTADAATHPTAGAVIVAAGTGERFGGMKQLAKLGDKPALLWSVAAAKQSCEQVVVVLPAAAITPPKSSDPSESRHRENLLCSLAEAGATVVAGGATRFDSVKAGVAELPKEIGLVVVHDAVRPGATKAMFEAVIAAVRAGADAAVPMLPVVDTLKHIKPRAEQSHGHEQSRGQSQQSHDQSHVVVDHVVADVVETLDRSQLALAQTPQAFDRKVLEAAHRQLESPDQSSPQTSPDQSSPQTSPDQSSPQTSPDQSSPTQSSPDQPAVAQPAPAQPAPAQSKPAPTFTDDAALVESQAAKVVAVAGDPAAHKITTPADLVVVAALMGINPPTSKLDS